MTHKVSVSDRLINGSIGTVKHLDRRSNPLCSTIYVKFGDSKAGNSLKDRRLRGELKECVPIIARAKKFPFKKKEKILLLLKENNFCSHLGT